MGVCVASCAPSRADGRFAGGGQRRDRQPMPWVSFGTGLVLVSWVVTSIAFGLYVTYVASYTSVFGHLASVFVPAVPLAVANAFLVGIQLDACTRERT